MEDLPIGWGEYVKRSFDRLHLNDLAVGQEVSLYRHAPIGTPPEFSQTATKRCGEISRIAFESSGNYRVLLIFAPSRTLPDKEDLRFNADGYIRWLLDTQVIYDLSSGTWRPYGYNPPRWRNAGYLLAAR